MKYNPVLSIIVVCFKTEKYIDRCVQSLIDQTLKNIEIILVDAASPDSTPIRCDRWSRIDERITVIHKEDNGLSDDRNAGISNAKGLFITFVDGDDFIEKDAYETMVNYALCKELDIVTCGRYIDDGKGLKKQFCGENKIFNSEEAIKEILECGSINEAAWDKIYKRELFSERQFPIVEINEDLLLIIDLFSQSKKIGFIGLPFYHYCVNEGSLTRSGYNEKKDIYINHMIELDRVIKNKYPQISSSVAVLCCSYSTGAIMCIQNTRDWRNRYLDSYKKYKAIIHRTYKKFLNCNNIPLATKIKCLLIEYNLYGPLHFLKNIGKQNRY